MPPLERIERVTATILSDVRLIGFALLAVLLLILWKVW